MTAPGVDVTTIAIGNRLEATRVYTPLGIRFWDSALDQPVKDGLHVTAIHASGYYPPVVARRSSTGIYAFHELPLLRSVEYPQGDVDAATPTPRYNFIIVAEDTLRRFLRCVFVVTLPLPYRGVFLAESAGSPLGVAGRAYLFSAPTRVAPAGMGAVRAELWDLGAAEPGPAAYTAVRVDVEGRTFRGVSDDAGRVLVLFPYPTLEQLRLGSPPGMGQRPVTDTQWPVTLGVSAPPIEPSPLAAIGSAPVAWRNTPSVKATFTAPGALLWPSDTGASEPSMTRDVRYGEELFMRTEGAPTLRSRLWIRATSP